MFISLLFRACFLELFLLFFDCFPNCAKPKNIENSLVLIQYFALGTFRKRTNKNKKTMQKLKQFLHWFFIKNHDFFGFKISMDFWMVFSLKMASKSKPFSMKKPSKKQDVFRASQKSFFFAFLERSGTVPDDRIDFFFSFFRFLVENGVQNGLHFSPGFSPEAPRNAPKTLQNRICDATSTFHRFCMDFGSHFHWFLMILDAILGCFFAGSPFSPFPKYLPTNTDSPVSPQGCGGLRPAHTMTFDVPFCIEFSMFFKNGESVK